LRDALVGPPGLETHLVQFGYKDSRLMAHGVGNRPRPVRQLGTPDLLAAVRVDERAVIRRLAGGGSTHHPRITCGGTTEELS
jgi:hypothetical protein